MTSGARRSVDNVARLMAGSLKAACGAVVANVDTLGGTGVITMDNGQQFVFDVREAEDGELPGMRKAS